jgi:hypothetical protein
MSLQSSALNLGKTRADFNDFVCSSFVYFGIFSEEVVKDVEGKGTVPSAHFID